MFESNGGTVEVLVRVVVPVKPFPEGVLSGRSAPVRRRHKAKDAPKEAAVLIESGALARWYESNGWDYPVAAPAPPAWPRCSSSSKRWDWSKRPGWS